MKAWPVVLAAFAVLLAAGLTACGGSSKKPGTGVTTPGGLAALYSGIFRTGHFDPRWRAPRGYHYRHSGKQPSATQFLVFVHVNAGSGGYWLEDGNLWVDNGQGLGPKVDAALRKLHQISRA